jgi:hypothetical protein
MKTIREFVANMLGQVIVFLFFFLILGALAVAASKSISAAGELHWLFGVLLGCVWLIAVLALYFVIWYAMRPTAPEWLSSNVLLEKKTSSDAGLAEQYPGATLSALICVGMLIAVFVATSISTILASKGVFTYAIDSHHDKPMTELLFRLYMWNTIDLFPLVEVWKTYGITPPVRPTNVWAQTIVLIFRTAIIGFAISVILQWRRFNRERRKTDGAVG